MSNGLPQPVNCCTTCDDPVSVAVPGPEGDPGAECEPCEDGQNAFTFLAAQFTMPAEGDSAVATVEDSDSFVIGEIATMEFMGVAVPNNFGYFEVTGKSDSTHITLKNVKNTAGSLYLTNATPGTIAPVGSLVSHGGLQGPIGPADAGALQADQNLLDVDDPEVARDNLGLGTMSVQNFHEVSITGGVITGLTQFEVEAANREEIFNGLSPLTTRGDLLTVDAGPDNIRLPIGAANTVVVTDGVDPSWGKVTSAMLASGLGAACLQMVSDSEAGAIWTNASFAYGSDTVPGNTEGYELLSVTITPSANTTRILIEAFVPVSSDAACTSIAALFRDSTIPAIAATALIQGISDTGQLHLTHEVQSGSTAATTFKIRIGVNPPTASHSLAVNGTNNGAACDREFGGISRAWLRVTEYSA